MLKIKLINGAKELKRGTSTSTGLDLVSLKEYKLKPMDRVLVETGVCVEPESKIEYEDGIGIVDMQIRPRSGLSSKGIIAHLGTVDEDYKGECKVSIINLSGEDYTIKEGDKVAQLTYGYAFIPHIQYVDELSDSERGTSGFGSTGD